MYNLKNYKEFINEKEDVDKNKKTSNEINDVKKNITFLIGAPGSGKTTWIKKNVDVKNTYIISRDDIVNKIRKSDEYNLSYKEAFNNKILQTLVNRGLKNSITKAFESNLDIVVDMTNMSKKSRKNILNITPDNYNKIAVVLLVPREELIDRLEKRTEETGQEVGIDVLDRMLNNYEKPTQEEGFDEVIINKFK